MVDPKLMNAARACLNEFTTEDKSAVYDYYGLLKSAFRYAEDGYKDLLEKTVPSLDADTINSLASIASDTFSRSVASKLTSADVPTNSEIYYIAFYLLYTE